MSDPIKDAEDVDSPLGQIISRLDQKLEAHIQTKENFGRPGVVDYRNPHLAEAMKVLGYVQRFGVGIQLAQEALRKNGNPLANFTVEDTFVHVEIGRAM